LIVLVDSVAILTSMGARGMEPLSTTLFTALGAALGAVLGGTAQAAGEDTWKSVRDKLARLARPQEHAQAQAFEAAVRQALTAFRRLYPDDPAARQALTLLREHAPLREAALDALLLRARPDLGRLLDLYRRELRFRALLRREELPPWEQIETPLTVLLGVLLPRAMAEQAALRPLLLEQAELEALDVARATAAATADSAATLRRIEALLGELVALPLIGQGVIGGDGATISQVQQITVQGHYYAVPQTVPVDLEYLLRSYHEFLIGEYGTLDFRGIPQMQNVVRLPLEQLYIPLRGLRSAQELPHRLLHLYEVPKTATTSMRIEVRGRSLVEASLDQHAQPQPLHDLIRDTPLLVLLGDPGAGKSTLVRVVLLALAEGRAQERLGLGGAWLPILVPVAAFAEARQHQPDLAPLEYLRAHALGRSQFDATPLFERALLAGRAFLLFDGLDEVASDRWTIVRCLEAFVRRWEPFGNRFIATSRVAGYDDAPLDASLFVRATIQPFDDDDIQRFLRQWSYAYERADPSRTSEAVADAAARRAAALTEAVFASENVQALARNPLLLTIIALIHQQGTRLPDRRVDLYQLCVETLAETWNRARSLSDRPINVYLGDEKLDERRVVNLLGPVALWVHQEQPGGLVEQADLERQLAQTLQQSDGLPPGKAQRLAGDFVKLVREHTGLLQERGQRQFGFLHLTFEEYLAARALVESALVSVETLIHQYATDPRWREVLRLALASTIQREAQRLLLHLLDAPAEGEARGQPVVLAGECLLDLGRNGATQRAWDAVITRLTALLEDQQAQFATRVAGGRVLGLLGDPRLLDVRTGDAPIGGYWCPVEAGPFWFGDDRTEELQQTEQPYPFKIARFAVTNAEYRRFVEADGYNPDQPWWSEEGRKWLLPGGHPVSWEDNDQPITRPWSWDQEQYNQPSQPVVGVSWYEAVAYAAWLTIQGHTHGWLPPDAVLRLLTWREWHRAARHTDQRRYPWGDAAPSPEHANYDETGLRTTAAVGCFPVGQAVCGVHDLVGNVWEWTATIWEQTQQPEPIGDVVQQETPIIAGGAFPDSNERLCCGARNWIFPHSWYDDVGFRVIWSLRSLV